jgi:ubiquinone/menaquinone biosynthesis C-methylase UbiE
MTPHLLKYLCEPITKLPLKLFDAIYDESGAIKSGKLFSSSGNCYPIVNGIPRFAGEVEAASVKSFGDEWNFFNFTDFKENWLQHTVANTFGSVEVFKDKLIVDAGGGSGAQSKWFLEYGAKHVILMDLSHSVDDVVQRNLSGLSNIDVIQCSIDAPPFFDGSINGIIYCHNVIQHTRSVEKTAHALFRCLEDNGEFVFNCYPLNNYGVVRWLRFNLIYKPLRATLSRSSFDLIKSYSQLISCFRLVPVFGYFLEKAGFCVTGKVLPKPNESYLDYKIRVYKNTVLNTFDCYGSHTFQHLKTENEIRLLVQELQPNDSKVDNLDKYFQRPTPVGCALRIYK